MNKKDKIEQQINITLDQLDRAEQLPPNPYFYTRVQARLEEKRNPRTLFSAILKPALLTTLVAINLSTAFWYMSRNDQTTQQNEHLEFIELLSSELKIENSQSNILDIK